MRIWALVVVLLTVSWLGSSAIYEGPSAVIGHDPSSLPTPPPRIVSTNLPTDEILLSLVPGAELTAVSTFADDPIVSNIADLARSVPHRVRGDSESIAALRPGVVFTYPFSRPEGQALLQTLDIPVVHVASPNTIDEIRVNIRMLGEIVAETRKAEAIIAGMDETLREVEARVVGVERPGVVLYNRSGYTQGQRTLFDEFAQIAGARNLAAEAGLVGLARMPDELLLSLDPEVIFVLDYRADSRERSLAEPLALVEEPLFANVKAVRTNRVFEIPARALLSTSHFAIEAARMMAEQLHPERFAQVSR